MPSWKKVIVSGSDATLNSLIVSNGITGSLQGTASFAITASFVTSASRAVSSSFATTASFVTNLNQNVLITGSTTIGATSAGASENTLTLGARDAGSEGGQIGFNAPGGTYTSASMIDNYANSFRILKGNNTTSTGLVAQWNLHTTQLQLPGYTSATSFTGTATANLAVDSSGNVITVSTSGGTVFPYTGNAVITGSLTTTGAVIAQANGAMYFRGGDDAEFWDINVANTVGIYGQQDATVGSIKLGSGGGIISGKSGNIGIGTTNPTSASLQVNGNVFASSFTGSLFGTASWATNVVNNGVTSVGGTGTVNGITLTGTVTSTGNLTLGGTLSGIGNSQLTNSAITIAGTSTSLGGSISQATILAGSGVFSGSAQISGLTNSNLSGTAGITNANLANSAITIAGTSTSLGSSITAATILSGTTVLSGSITNYLPAGTVSGSSQITNIANSQLTNSAITIGSTAISLGATSTTLAGLTNVTSTNFTGSLQGTASYALNSLSASFAPTFPFTGSARITGSLSVTGSMTALNSATSTPVIIARGGGGAGNVLSVQTTAGTEIVGIGFTGATGIIQNGNSLPLRLSATNADLIMWNNGTGNLTFTTNGTEKGKIFNNGNFYLGTTPTDFGYKLDVSGSARISGAGNTSVSSSLVVYGSGSTQPVLTVQGSQGELFSVTDSLSGSLFSVNDISGLPIMEVFSDNTTLMGSYQAPSLNTTVRTTTVAGNNIIYSIPTASFNGAWFEYVATSASNARSGQIMSVCSSNTIQYTETTTTDIGTTAGLNFRVMITGSNFALTGSSTTAGWTVKTIVRSI